MAWSFRINKIRATAASTSFKNVNNNDESSKLKMKFSPAGAADVRSLIGLLAAKVCLVALLASGLVISEVEALDKVRIAVSNPNMPNLTVAMAQQKGFFKDETIEAEIIRMNPNVAVTALATGDVDYCQLFGAVVGGAIAGSTGPI